MGTSPECEMAIATVLYYESLHDRIRNRKRVEINGATYDLVLFATPGPTAAGASSFVLCFPILLGGDRQVRTEPPRKKRP